MELTKRICLSAILFVSIANIGCTRDVPMASKFSISVSGQSSLSAAGSQVTNVIINVRGSGISKPIKYNWDAHCKGYTCTSELLPVPSSFDFNVPSGPKRLIQVLIVSRSNQTGQMVFRYGDVERDLSPGFNEVNISAAQIGEAGAKETRVFGRYLEAAGQTRTGRVRVEIQPPAANRPPMYVMDEFIFSGWMKIMFIPGIQFRYFLEPSNIEIMANASPNSPDFAPSSKSLHVNMPTTYYREENYDGTLQYFLGDFGKIITGFFGPGAISDEDLGVCYNDSNGETIHYLFATNSNTEPLEWYGSTSTGPFTDRVYPTTGSGLPSSDSICESENGQEFSQKITFDHNNLASGNDYMGGFFGPFVLQYNDDYYNPLEVSYNSASNVMQIEWDYLPGVFDGDRPITGVVVFVKSPNHTPDPNFYGSNDYSEEDPCDKQLKSEGFVFQAVLYGSTVTTHVQTDVEDQSTTELAICPFRDEFGVREFFASSIRTYNGYYGGGGGGSPVAAMFFNTTSYIDFMPAYTRVLARFN